jgi:hypothetical protein
MVGPVCTRALAFAEPCIGPKKMISFEATRSAWPKTVSSTPVRQGTSATYAAGDQQLREARARVEDDIELTLGWVGSAMVHQSSHNTITEPSEIHMRRPEDTSKEAAGTIR